MQLENTLDTNMFPQSIGMNGIVNARELGGYTGVGGRKVKRGVLLRTGALLGLTEADRNHLLEQYHLTDIVDFRTSFECAAAPDPEMVGAVYHPIRILDEQGSQTAGMAAAATGDGFPLDKLVEYIKSGKVHPEDMYVDIVLSTVSMEGYRQFFDCLLEHQEGAVLWHCSAGKDRTGLGAAFLLAILGADRQTIMDDYSLTNVYFQHILKKMEIQLADFGLTEAEMEDMRAVAGGVNPAYLEKALDVIEERYGSLDVYLEKELGITEEKRLKLQEMYLEV